MHGKTEFNGNLNRSFISFNSTCIEHYESSLIKNTNDLCQPNLKLLQIYSTDRNLGLDTGFYFQYYVRKYNIDKDCMSGLTGISIMLHAPDEIPSIMKIYTNVAILSNAMISIKPHVTKLSVELHSMKPEMLVLRHQLCSIKL